MLAQTIRVVGAVVATASILVGGWAGVAHAVDGVVLITQSLVMASGGFPFTITQPGSYRLAGNLAVPLFSDGIIIAANNVTLDLNGFAIVGGGSGNGIGDGGTRHTGITVRNGTVSNFLTGISLVASDASVIEQVRAIFNNFLGTPASGTGGILAGAASTVNGNTAFQNGGTGIAVGIVSTVSGNTSTGNDFGMVISSSSIITGNTASSNQSIGMEVNCPANLVGNTAVFNGNGTNNIVLTGSGCTRSNNNPAP